ncbi:MAG: Ig-like domain-containing protein [Chloroflexi bacterium]|nr:Ig-like domain-containing protein [Chloroflexota bacterium]
MEKIRSFLSDPKFDLAFLIALCLLLASAGAARAQQAGELELNLARDFGYSSGTGRVQGTFSMKASGPEDLARVIFLVDGEAIGEANAAPFQLQFHTGSFALGKHTLSARGITQDGRELASNEIHLEFVSAEEGPKAAARFALPILGVALGVMLLSFLLPTLLGRGKLVRLEAGAPRNYGFLGGGICSKCGRPFALHIWSMNFGIAKLERCPYCGRWGLIRRASMAELRAAEEAEVSGTPGERAEAAAEEKQRKELDDSRFIE